MAEQAAAVEPSHPPDAVLRVVNPMVRLLLRSPVAGPLRKQLMVLRFTGRKTGHRYDVPVAAHQVGDELWSLTGAGWRHNFGGGADVEVTLDGRTTRMRGELVTNPDAVAHVYARRIDDLGVKRAQRLIGIKIHTPGTPTTQALAEAVKRYHLATIRFTPKA